MAEAVGLVGSIAGLIDVTAKLVSFANTAKNMHKDEQDFVLEATNSLGLLFRLKQRLEDPSTSEGWRSAISRSMGDLLTQLKTALVDLTQELHLDATGSHKVGRMELTSTVKSDTAAIKEDTALIRPIKDEVSRIISHAGTAVDAAMQQRIDKIMCFMAPCDFGSKLSDFRSSRVPETGTWFVESPQFREWVHNEGDTLWCQGIPGAGKTILVSMAIDHLRHKFLSQNGTQIVYAFCDYKHRGEQDVRTMLASLWKQLARSRVLDIEECETFEATYLKPNVKPAKNEILTILRDEIARYSRIFILLDAFDEFHSDHRTALLVALRDLGPNVNLLVTSRYIETDMFDPKRSRLLEISAADSDIRIYISGRLRSETRLGQHIAKDPVLADEIPRVIIQKAQGMQLHLNALATKLTPKAVRKGLETLPQGKDAVRETYTQALSRIENQNPEERHLAERVIAWLCYSLRPLKLAELQYAMSVDPEDDDDFGEEDLVPGDVIVSVCAGLVSVDSSNLTIGFVHYTAQEFFKNIRAVRFPCADAQIATTCLTFLSRPLFTLTRLTPLRGHALEFIDNNPLLMYASANWGHHARRSFKLCQPLIHPISGREACNWQNSSPHNDSEVCSSSVCRELKDTIKGFTTLHHQFLCAYYMLLHRVCEDPQYFFKDDWVRDVELREEYVRLGNRPGPSSHLSLYRSELQKGHAIPRNCNRYALNWYAYFGLDELIIDLVFADARSLHRPRGTSWNVLHWAVLGGHTSTLNLLLEDCGLGKLLSKEENCTITPLHIACVYARREMVETLLDFGADPGIYNHRVKNALHLAVRGGDLKTVEAILATDKSESLLLTGDCFELFTPLHQAARARTPAVDVMKCLFAALPTDLDIRCLKTNCGENPLHLAAQRPHTGLSVACLESKIGLQLAHDRDDLGWTPFDKVATLELNVTELFRAWVGLELFKDCSYVAQSALRFAVMTGKTDVIDILLKSLTRVDIWTEGGVTLLHIAAERGWVKIIDLLLRRLSEDDLLEKRDPDWRTALLTAASMGHPEACDLLIKNGADVNSQDRAGQTALHIAASDNLDTVAAVLVNSGNAIIHASDTNGRTPLSIAEAGNSNEVIRILMDAGAETHRTTPFDVRRTFAPESARDQYTAAFYLKSASPEPLPMRVISYILDLAEYWVESRVHRAKTLVMDWRDIVTYLCSPVISGFAREPVRKIIFSVTSHLQANYHPGSSDSPAWLKADRDIDGYGPSGGPNIRRPCSKLDEKRELITLENKQLKIENVGLGADWAPFIEWKCNLTDLEEDAYVQYQCEMVLQRLAVKFGFRYVQVYAPPHRTMAVWDRKGDKDGKHHQRLWPADYHITVRFGFGPDHCSVHGHVFLAEDDDAEAEENRPAPVKEVSGDAVERKGQALPDEIFWLAAKHFLETPHDMFSLAASSRSLWNVLKIELYATAINLYRQFETVKDIRKDVPLRTRLPPFDIEPLDFPPQIAQELMRDRNGPEETREPAWKEFFSRPRMSQQSPLHWAAANGYTEMARALVQAAENTWPEFINAKDPNGDTAIHVAAEKGHLDIVRLLVDSSCFKNVPSGYFYWTTEIRINDPYHRHWGIGTETLTDIINDIVPGAMQVSQGHYRLAESSPRFAIDALGLSILNGHEDIANYLLNHHDAAFAADWHIISPLHLAALAGQDTILERMLIEGSDPNLRCPQFDDATPSHMAAATNNGPAILELLQKHGADLNQRDQPDRPPLRWAVDHNSMDSAMSLIKLGVELESDTMAACMQRDDWWPCTELLLETVRRTPEVLWHGESTLQQCTQFLISGCKADSKNLKTVEHLIKKRIGLGAIDARLHRNPSCGETEGLSSLHVAAISDGFPEHLFKLLLEQRPVDINSRDPEGYTPLDNAMLRNKAWKVELIREYGGRAAHEVADEKKSQQTDG
ncbi:hypothetical protein DL769_009874 [Monosporascus sp. CRB-8-3]|nr:hypothetical protein DL769_009874 [Monosporascus sp. CRB-8-3]